MVTIAVEYEYLIIKYRPIIFKYLDTLTVTELFQNMI